MKAFNMYQSLSIILKCFDTILINFINISSLSSLKKLKQFFTDFLHFQVPSIAGMVISCLPGIIFACFLPSVHCVLSYGESIPESD